MAATSSQRTLYGRLSHDKAARIPEPTRQVTFEGGSVLKGGGKARERACSRCRGPLLTDKDDEWGLCADCRGPLLRNPNADPLPLASGAGSTLGGRGA